MFMPPSIVSTRRSILAVVFLVFVIIVLATTVWEIVTVQEMAAIAHPDRPLHAELRQGQIMTGATVAEDTSTIPMDKNNRAAVHTLYQKLVVPSAFTYIHSNIYLRIQ